MERFCEKCGSLVSGDGEFCPSCGARMSSAFSNNSIGNVGGVDLSKQGDSMPNNSYSGGYQSPYQNGQPAPVNNTYSGQSNYNGQVYPGQTYNGINNAQNQVMSVGEWALTIFLSGLGIIGIVLLFIWAFDSTTPQNKKNYARAMLIFEAIAVGLAILFVIISIGIGFSVADSIAHY